MTPRPYAIVCPGQGSQHSGMLDRLPERDQVERLLDAAEALSDLELRSYDHLADALELADTRVAQPLLYLADWVWGTALLESGLAPIAVAGHSLGEFAALALAGVFSVEAGLHLVVERSSLMATAASAHPGSMAAAIGLSASDVSDAIDAIPDVWVANDNCPGQIVVSGTTGAVDTATEALYEAGARKVVPLAVSGAFHTPLLDDAATAFAATLESADFADATLPVVQNSKPEAPLTDAGLIRENLVNQMTSPVRWSETMSTLRGLGVEILVEAGPGTVLKGLAKRTDGLVGVSVEEVGIDAVMEEVAV